MLGPLTSLPRALPANGSAVLAFFGARKLAPLILILVSLLSLSCDYSYHGLSADLTESYDPPSTYEDGVEQLPGPANAAGPVRPDDIQCDEELGFHRGQIDTVGDLSGEDGLLPLLYYIDKFLFPRLQSDCQVEEFFRDQDLSFDNEWTHTADAVSTVSISAVGDLMVRRRINEQNGIHLYDDIEDALFSADIVFGNLETPADPGRESRPFPAFNLSAEATRLYLGTDRDHGFDIVSTANNHVLDQEEEGLIATLDYLDELGVRHVGSSRTMEERDEGLPIIEENGIKIAFLAYTFATNGRPLPLGREYEVNLVQLNTLDGPPDISLIEEHLETAREFGADVVAVSLHWGLEYEFYPPRRIIDLGHRLADAGADLILGHHPHILNPLESYVPPNRDRGVPEVLIAYSLGNFIPSQSRSVFRTSIVLHVNLSRGTVDGDERVWISQVDYTPVWWHARTVPNNRDYRLIDLDRALAEPAEYPFLGQRDWDKLRSARRLIIDRF